jgi:hypothetical protein
MNTPKIWVLVTLLNLISSVIGWQVGYNAAPRDEVIQLIQPAELRHFPLSQRL